MSTLVPEYIRVDSLGDAMALKLYRERVQAHVARTGGTYSTHEHGGNCMVCGSVNAVYTILFYHAKSNTYIRLGQDCAEKLDMGNSFEMNSFRKTVENVREALAGKRKAQALLADAGLEAAWAVYTSDLSEYPAGQRIPYEVVTVRDIVGKLVKYGSISPKATEFVRALLVKLANLPKLEAERAAEKAAAADCPTGRVQITGTVLKVALYSNNFSRFGDDIAKMTVKANEGFIVFVTVPSGLSAERGQTVTFTATLTPSDNDPKFGFGKRPTGGKGLSKTA